MDINNINGLTPSQQNAKNNTPVQDNKLNHELDYQNTPNPAESIGRSMVTHNKTVTNEEVKKFLEPLRQLKVQYPNMSETLKYTDKNIEDIGNMYRRNPDVTSKFINIINQAQYNNDYMIKMYCDSETNAKSFNLLSEIVDTKIKAKNGDDVLVSVPQMVSLMVLAQRDDDIAARFLDIIKHNNITSNSFFSDFLASFGSVDYDKTKFDIESLISPEVFDYSEQYDKNLKEIKDSCKDINCYDIKKEDVYNTLALMQVLNPENYKKLINSDSFEKIKKGNIHADLLKDIKFTDEIEENHLDKLVEHKNKELDKIIATDTRLEGINKAALGDFLHNFDCPLSRELRLNDIFKCKDKDVMQRVINEYCAPIIQNGFTENNKQIQLGSMSGLIRYARYSPKKMQKIEEMGILDLIKKDPKYLRIFDKFIPNTQISPAIIKDYERVKNGQSIVLEFEDGTDLDKVFSQTDVGNVVSVGDNLYINDGEQLYKWKMTKDKYLELFPPIDRYLTNQGKSGDCYLVSSLMSSMYNPFGRANFYKSFEQDGNDIKVSIQGYNGYDSSYVFKDSKIDLNKSGNNLDGCKGLQMYEHLYMLKDLRQKFLDDTPLIDPQKMNIEDLQKRLKNGTISEAMSDIHGLSNNSLAPMEKIKNKSMLEIFGSDILDDLPKTIEKGVYIVKNNSPEKMKEILEKYSNKKEYIINFGTGEISPDDNMDAMDYGIAKNHAYSIPIYLPNGEAVVISDPHGTGGFNIVPLKDLCKFIDHIGITAFK